MYRYEDLREVDLELTTRCNASCPQCPRNLSRGAVNPALPMAELELADVRRILPRDLLGPPRSSASRSTDSKTRITSIVEGRAGVVS